MSWYYRILLSYAPIFFVVISVLIFTFSTILNNSAQNQIELTNQAIAMKVMQSVDTNLRAAERMVVKEMYTNEKLSAFFSGGETQTVSDYFTIARKLDDFSSILPFANSIYVYNEKSGKVLSRSGLSTLEQFGDSGFLRHAYEAGTGTAQVWTDPRGFKEFTHEEGEERVITLFKYYPFSGEKQGAVVVNIRVSALVSFIKDLTRYDAGLIQLYSTDREPFDRNYAASMRAASAAASAGAIKDNHRTISDYTGWSYAADMRHNKQMSMLSLFHDSWILVGLLTVAAGIIWFTYVTHRNYKPIQAIAGRIDAYTKRRSGELVRQGRSAFRSNELKYIEAAIDDLLERSSEYEQRYKDDLVLRKKQRLTEWLEGRTELSELQWKQEMLKLQVPVHYRRLATAVMEFDRYTRFTGRYNPRDQYLLKFVVGNVLQEIAQSEGIVLWQEWLEPQRMAVVFFMNEHDGDEGDKVQGAMRRLQAWVAANLEFTVSVGIGPDAAAYDGVAQSYKEAKRHLGSKPVFSLNCFIGKGEERPKEEGGIFPYVPSLTTLAKSFRLQDGQWQAHLHRLLQGLQTGGCSQSDLQHLMDCLQYQFHKELQETREPIPCLWKEEYAPQLGCLAEAAESLDDWHDRLRSLLVSLEPHLQAARESGSHQVLMLRVKQYLEMYYADPELSLNKISEHFDMNSRYLSKLFKEQFGEKFIDFMLKVRLEKAKELLLETDLPAQDIAERVGYVHVISFHRAFKNMFGCPPGDYRRRMEAASER